MPNDAPGPEVGLLEKRLRLAGALIVLGLLIQLITLVRIHPLSFMAFALIGCPLVLSGMCLYLYSIVSQPGTPSYRDDQK